MNTSSLIIKLTREYKDELSSSEPPQPGEPVTIEPIDVHLEEAGHRRQAVRIGIRGRASHQFRAPLEAHRAGAAPRDRQREVADSAEHVGDALARLRVEQRERAPHQDPVHRVVDLREVGGAEADLEVELGQRVIKVRRALIGHRAGRLRPARLKVNPDAMVAREPPQQLDVGRQQRLEHAQHQHVGFLAGRDLDLRQPAADGKGIDQAAQGSQQPRVTFRQHLAAVHVGDVAAALLVEAHQRSTLLRHVAHREPGAVAVAPGRAVYGRQHLLRPDPPDVPQAVLQHPLLDRDLRARVEVLQAATSAKTEVAAARRHALGGRLDHLDQGGDFVCRLLAVRRAGDALARQRALDKNGLAVAARDAATFLVQRLDQQRLLWVTLGVIESFNRNLCVASQVLIPLGAAKGSRHDYRCGGVKVRRERGSAILAQYCQPKNGTTKDTKDTKEYQN